MAQTGFLFATSTQVSTGTWTTTDSMKVTDGVEATCTISTKNTSSVARLHNFGFTTTILPDTATIQTVNLQAIWRVTTTGGIANLAVAAHHSSAGLLSTHINTLEPTSLSTQVFDITADRAWAPADFRDGTLTLHVRPNNGNSATNPFYRFDSFALDVIYGLPVTPRTLFQPPNLDGCGSDGIFVGNSVE